ncbi:sugar ABC transporter substrate-binding protein, partial [Micromonospora azadirachtae]
MTEHSRDLSRRRLLFGGAAVGAGVLLAGCTSNETEPTAAQTKGA